MISSGIACRKNARKGKSRTHGKAAHPGHRRVRCRSPAQTHRRPLETAAAVSPVRRQGAALLGPGAADSRHLAKDADPTAAPARTRRPSAAHCLRAGTAAGGLPPDAMGPGAVPCAGCNAHLGPGAAAAVRTVVAVNAWHTAVHAGLRTSGPQHRAYR